MSATSIIKTVVGFLGHHVNDLVNVSSALGDIVNSLPIDTGDKERITGLVEELNNSAANIASFLANNKITGADVTIKESDIEHAVAVVLPNLIAKGVEDYIAAHPLDNDNA